MRYYDYSPMYQQHSFFWQGGLVHILLNVLIWGLIIYLVVHLIRKMKANHGGCCGMHCEHNEELSEEKNDEYYLDIAKERYAKGEIDKKHYDDLKNEFSLKNMESHEDSIQE